MLVRACGCEDCIHRNSVGSLYWDPEDGPGRAHLLALVYCIWWCQHACAGAGLWCGGALRMEARLDTGGGQHSEWPGSEDPEGRHSQLIDATGLCNAERVRSPRVPPVLYARGWRYRAPHHGTMTAVVDIDMSLNIWMYQDTSREMRLGTAAGHASGPGN